MIHCRYEGEAAEELFCSLQIIDVDTKIKMGERFHFSISEQRKTSPGAVFTLPKHYTKSTYLVLNVCKKFNDIAAKRFSWFKKPNTMKNTSAVMLGEYKQHVCWYVIPLNEVRKGGTVDCGCPMKKPKEKIGNFWLEVRKFDRKIRTAQLWTRVNEYTVSDPTPRYWFEHFIVIRPVLAEFGEINVPESKGSLYLIKVQIMESECKAIRCIQIEGSERLTSKAYCCISNTPKWNDEFKALIPLQIHQKHHILLTIYHITNKSPTDYSLKTIGYAIFPLQVAVMHRELTFKGAIITSLQENYMNSWELYRSDTAYVKCNIKMVKKIEIKIT